MSTTDSELALIPIEPDIADLLPAHQDFQRSVFGERRQMVLTELRMASGVPGLIRELKPDKIYRLVVPEGEVLQQGTDGLYNAVLRGSDGKISKHAKFEKIPPNLSRIASAVGSQVMLISIAMQLNRIEKAISRINEELHNDRIAMILAGKQQYEMAMYMTNCTRRDNAIQHAIQSLTEGLIKVRLELRGRIERLPEPVNTFWENWGTRKSTQAATELRMAEETFDAAVQGASLLSQCYAALDEPQAGIVAINHCLRDIRACGIQKAAERARIVEVRDTRYLPEAPWLSFDALESEFAKNASQFPLKPEIEKRGSFAIEFTKSELMEEKK